ncbi:MAG: TIGR02597 family protein [Opitutaceae bacterium]
MPNPKIAPVITVAFGLLLSAVVADSQSVTTTPVGVISYVIAAGTQQSPVITSVYFGLTGQPTNTGATSGRISAVGGSTFSCQGAGWEAGSLSLSTTPYLIRLTSGAAAGTTWQISAAAANTTETVTVLNNGIDLTSLGITASSSTGDTFELLPAATLASLFGINLPVQGTGQASGKLAGGTSSTVADTISVWNGAIWLIFFYDTGLGWWRRDVDGSDAANSRNNFVIRPDACVLIARKGDAVTLRSIGRAPASALKARYLSGGSAGVGLFPITNTLGALNLQSLAGWVGIANTTGQNVGAADQVAVWEGTAWASFYYDTTAASPRWRRVGTGADATSYTIQTPDRPFMIQKLGTENGSAFISQARPY